MSARIVALIALADGVGDADADALVGRLAGAADSVAEVVRTHAARHSPGTIGGGDITCDLFFESDAQRTAFLARGDADAKTGLVGALGSEIAELRDRIARVDAVAVDPIAQGVGREGLVGVKRTLLFRIYPEAGPDAVARFEREMLEMPAFVPAIRNWSFARAGSQPATHWTHVWEQEFERIEGLHNDYMMSPYHWGLIDGWFDPECPHAIVDPRIAHVYCPESAPVLSWSNDPDHSSLRADERDRRLRRSD